MPSTLHITAGLTEVEQAAWHAAVAELESELVKLEADVVEPGVR